MLNSITQNDISAGGRFRVCVQKNSQHWLITPMGVIVPGASKPTQSELNVENCVVGKPLQFRYFEDRKNNPEGSLVSTDNAVKWILREK